MYYKLSLAICFFLIAYYYPTIRQQIYSNKNEAIKTIEQEIIHSWNEIIKIPIREKALRLSIG